MENKSISLSIEEARYMYKSNDENIRNIALRAYSKEQLSFDFSGIKTFEDACMVLGLNYKKCSVKAKEIAKDSKASAAMYKLNLVRKALNVGQNLHFAENPKGSLLRFPCNQFITNDSDFYEDKLSSGKMEIIGKFRCDGEEYKVLGGQTYDNGGVGFGCFNFSVGVGYAPASIGFLGCVSKEIAEHLGKYFGMLIIEAKYGDMIEDFEIIESKYKN